MTDHRIFESDLIIATTQRSVFRVKNGRVSGYASIASLNISGADDLVWRYLKNEGDEKLIVCNHKSKDVLVFSGDELTKNDDAATTLAALIADVDYFRLTASSINGESKLCVFGTVAGTRSLSRCDLTQPLVDVPIKNTLPIAEGTRKALIGFRNVVRSATSAMESEERKINDKKTMIQTFRLMD